MLRLRLPLPLLASLRKADAAGSRGGLSGEGLLTMGSSNFLLLPLAAALNAAGDRLYGYGGIFSPLARLQKFEV